MNDVEKWAESVNEAIRKRPKPEDKFKGKCVPTKAIRLVIEANMDMQNLYLPVHFLDLVESMPQLDMAVRCRNCKFHGTEVQGEDELIKKVRCKLMDDFKDADWFCADGEQATD